MSQTFVSSINLQLHTIFPRILATIKLEIELLYGSEVTGQVTLDSNNTVHFDNSSLL